LRNRAAAARRALFGCGALDCQINNAASAASRLSQTGQQQIIGRKSVRLGAAALFHQLQQRAMLGLWRGLCFGRRVIRQHRVAQSFQL